MPDLSIVPTQFTLRLNVGSLDAPWAAQLFTFGPRVQGIVLRGSWMVSKNQQKIGKENEMPNLPIVPIQVTLRGDVGSLDAPRADQLLHLALGGRLLHWEGG